jgi:post-segregation antitoxin (ccd killing protein)
VIILGTITIKVDDDLKKAMRMIKINWSEYIREAIRRRIELEERRRATEKLLESLRSGKHTVPRGFINETLREIRGTR